MRHLYAKCLLLLLQICMTVNGIKDIPGVPIPGAELLEDILAKHLPSDGSLINYLKGNHQSDNHNLDITVLDVQNVRKIIKAATKNYEKNYRRWFFSGSQSAVETTTIHWNNLTTLLWNKEQTAGFKKHTRDNMWGWPTNRFGRQIDKLYQLMLTCIYTAQYRIEDCKKIRHKFMAEPAYKMALLYSSCTNTMNRMTSLYTQAQMFETATHFIWYLIIYEKLIAMNVDVGYACEKIFLIEEEYHALRAARGLPRIPKEARDHPKFKEALEKLEKTSTTPGK